jgi:hypothetical protein
MKTNHTLTVPVSKEQRESSSIWNETFAVVVTEEQRGFSSFI